MPDTELVSLAKAMVGLEVKPVSQSKDFEEATGWQHYCQGGIHLTSPYPSKS